MVVAATRGLGARRAIKVNQVDVQVAGLAVAVLRQLEPDGDGATALVVADVFGLGRAPRRIPAGGAVGHAIDNVYLCLDGGRDSEVGDGERADVYPSGDHQGGGAAARELSRNASALGMLVGLGMARLKRRERTPDAEPPKPMPDMKPLKSKPP